MSNQAPKEVRAEQVRLPAGFPWGWMPWISAGLGAKSVELIARSGSEG